MRKPILNLSNSSGYAVIFSVVVVSVIIIVTLAVSSIIQRELELSSIGQQSMEAFFAADAGIECALYWDVSERTQNVFRTSSSRSISCAGDTVTTRLVGGHHQFSIDGDFCATVRVEVNGTDTLVKASGYNTCNDDDPGRVERGLEVRY